MFPRKMLLISAVMIVVVALSGCGPAATPTPAEEPTEAPAQEATEAPTEEPTEAPETEEGRDVGDLKVAYLFPGVVNDGSYNTLGYNAMLDVEEDLGLDVEWNERVLPADAARVIGEFAASGVDAVWAHSGTYLDPVVNTAPNFPDVSFVTYAGLLQENPPPNVWQQLNLEGHREMFFMTGVMAGLMTESNVVGFVGGVELTTYAEGMKSFEMGARWVNPDIEVLKVWTGSWDDAPKAKEAAIGQIEQGADVMAHAVNLGVYGVVEAVEANPGIYFIGKDIDQSSLLPDRTLCSMFINYAEGMKIILPQIAAGELGGVFRSTLADGSVVVTELADWVPADKAAQYNLIKDKIMSHEIDVRPAAEEVEPTLPEVPEP